MKRLFLLSIALIFLHACKNKEKVDPNLRVRPVRLQMSVSGNTYKLSWEEIRIVCVTTPCPDLADVEAEEYEVQVSTNELGPFRTYETLGADKKSIDIPATDLGGLLVARIVSKAKGAAPVNSTAVTATQGFLSQTAYYPGFTISIMLGGDITPDGRRATYSLHLGAKPGEYSSQVYWAELEYERIAMSHLVAEEGSAGKFSPDGKQLAYFSVPKNRLVIYDTETRAEQMLEVPDAKWINGLDWSPDGKWLAFSTVSAEESRLWKIATSGGAAIPLTAPMPVREGNNIRQSEIDWSPDGQSIAVARARSEAEGKDWRTAISFYSPEGRGELKFFETQPEWIDTHPAISPDGKQLAFLSTRTNPLPPGYSLWIRDLASGKARRIELLPGMEPVADFAPKWQGNERLVFMGTRYGKSDYFSVFL